MSGNCAPIPDTCANRSSLRDRGVCAQCGLDTEALRKDKRKLDYARAANSKRIGDDGATCGTPTTSCR
jgi:hypothetical protein